ncbi:hypothetical protein C1645_821918 [Glomus cerebriforme]|uniref:Uncharacterized protein n=1 Tax=Glomus cerebriforme TaxID=658196 RepID=A0A397T8X8_9GLOM|nr:hypothetical protein C1645_821918 [Glomus cerebriforme]
MTIKLPNILSEIFQIVLRKTFFGRDNVVWLEQNFDLIYQMSFKDDSFLELQKYCTDLMSKVDKSKSRTTRETSSKLKDSNEVLGGHNPIKWKSDFSLGTTMNSFIFSFNNNKIEDYILSRAKGKKFTAIYSRLSRVA